MIELLAIAALAAQQTMPDVVSKERPPAATDQPTSLSGLNPAQMFKGAARLQAAGREADAEAIYRALINDPDLAIRNEARFRLALLKEQIDERREAAVLLRALLDEEPSAQRARLELARILALLGEEKSARRELRQAQAGGLPPDVARVVDQFQNALRSRAPLGASVEVAIAPDSNINRATSRSSLDTGFFPIELDEEAQAQSGLGITLSGQGFARLPISPRLSLLPRLSGSGRLYRSSQFNDISANAQLGLERTASNGARLTVSAGETRRWFGGARFTDTTAISLDWLHPAGSKAQFTLAASAARQRFKTNPGQNGELYQLSGNYEIALSARNGIGLGASMTRQTAVDSGFASWTGGASIVAHQEIAQATVFSSINVRRLEGDAPLFLFNSPRREWLLRSVIGATIRRAKFQGFAPVIRLVAERNHSTVGLFDYSRVALELGVSRAF